MMLNTVSKWETGRSAVPAWHQALLRLVWTATTPAQQVRVREILELRGPVLEPG